MSEIVFRQLSWNEIKPIWDKKLWSYREDNRPHSSMTMKGGSDYTIHDRYKWRAYGAVKINNRRVETIVGCNAGHKSGPRDYRTRGLFVEDSVRGLGIAGELFSLLETQAKMECCRWLWSYPRLSALPVYQKMGFEPYGATDKGEFDHCVKARKDLSIVVTNVYRLDDNPMEDYGFQSAIESLDKKEILLGQNEEVRGNFIHITQHWVNDQYIVKQGEPVLSIRGNLDNEHHVL